MKHFISTLYWGICNRVGGNLHLRIHRLLWVPAVIGGNMMWWWRQRDNEYANPGITAHGVHPWERHTGQRRHEGFYSQDSDPLFIVWRIGYRLYTIGMSMTYGLNRLVNCDCAECSCED